MEESHSGIKHLFRQVLKIPTHQMSNTLLASEINKYK